MGRGVRLEPLAIEACIAVINGSPRQVRLRLPLEDEDALAAGE